MTIRRKVIALARKAAGNLPPGLESEAVRCSNVCGEIGRVSMSVVLVPFPKPAAAAN